MASLTRWTWVWVNSGSWWWTGRPGMLQFMGLKRVGHDWVTELNWYGKESVCNKGDQGSIPGLGRSPGEGKGYPLQYSYLENSMDKGAWWATVHGVPKSQTKNEWLTYTAHSFQLMLKVWVQGRGLEGWTWECSCRSPFPQWKLAVRWYLKELRRVKWAEGWGLSVVQTTVDSWWIIILFLIDPQ